MEQIEKLFGDGQKRLLQLSKKMVANKSTEELFRDLSDKDSSELFLSLTKKELLSRLLN